MTGKRCEPILPAQSFCKTLCAALHCENINKTRANIKPALTLCVLAGRNTVRGLFRCCSEVAKTVSLCHVLWCNQSCAGKPISPIRKRLVREQHLSVCDRGCQRAAAWYAQPHQMGVCWQLCVIGICEQFHLMFKGKWEQIWLARVGEGSVSCKIWLLIKSIYTHRKILGTMIMQEIKSFFSYAQTHHAVSFPLTGLCMLLVKK